VSDPLREQIAQALLVKLQGVTRAGGYNTDLGLHVSRRRKAITDYLAGDLPAVALFSGERPASDPLLGRGGTTHQGVIEFVALAVVESEEPDRDVNLVEADLLKALLGDEDLGTLRVNVRDAGSATDYAEYAPQGRGFVQLHLAVDYWWTHAAP